MRTWLRVIVIVPIFFVILCILWLVEKINGEPLFNDGEDYGM